jgi:hypothetical protein
LAIEGRVDVHKAPHSGHWANKAPIDKAEGEAKAWLQGYLRQLQLLAAARVIIATWGAHRAHRAALRAAAASGAAVAAPPPSPSWQVSKPEPATAAEGQPERLFYRTCASASEART